MGKGLLVFDLRQLTEDHLSNGRLHKKGKVVTCYPKPTDKDEIIVFTGAWEDFPLDKLSSPYSDNISPIALEKLDG